MTWQPNRSLELALLALVVMAGLLLFCWLKPGPLAAPPFVAERAVAETAFVKPLPDRPNRNAVETYIVQGATAARRAPVVENEDLVTAEVLALESVQSAELYILPPQVFLRVRLRVLTIETAPGTSSFLATRESATLDAYTREQITPELVGRRIHCRLRYQGDERGGVYWLHNLRVVPAP